jgi:hypothetical protein
VAFTDLLQANSLYPFSFPIPQHPNQITHLVDCAQQWQRTVCHQSLFAPRNLSIWWLGYSLANRGIVVRFAAEVRETTVPCEESRPLLGPTKSPFPIGIAGAFLGAKQLGREADYSPPSSGAKVKNEWSCTSTIHTLPCRAQGEFHLHVYIYAYIWMEDRREYPYRCSISKLINRSSETSAHFYHSMSHARKQPFPLFYNMCTNGIICR